MVDLLPMADLKDLDPETSEYMAELALYSTGEKSNLVPSLFRHFICWPSLLTGLCDWLGLCTKRMSYKISRGRYATKQTPLPKTFSKIWLCRRPRWRRRRRR